MIKRDWNSTISKSTGALVVVIALIAFFLSYNALWSTALLYGLPDYLAWVWPLLIDFPLIVFSLAVVRAALLKESTVWPWSLVAVFTLATVAMNLLHLEHNIISANFTPATISQFVAIVAPVALLLSFETLMGMVKNGVKRAGSLDSIQQLNENIKELDGKLNTAQSQLDALETQRARVTAELDALHDVKQAALDEKSKEVGVSTDKVELARGVMQRYTSEGLALPSGAQLGRELGVTRTTGNKLKSLIEPEFATLPAGAVNGHKGG